MKRLVLLLALLVAPAAQAHSGYVDIKDHAFRPASVNVTEGVLVVWRWDGPDLNHTVSGEFFESDPGKEPLRVSHRKGDTFPVLFETAGTYAYQCRVHPEMTGEVVVEPPPAIDRVRPRLTGVRARVRKGKVAIGFTVDERASIIAELRRPGSKKVLRDSFRFAAPGARRTSIRLAGLGSGRFQVRLTAQDDGGNFSRPVTIAINR